MYWLLMVFAGCSGGGDLQSRCNKAFNDMCTLRVQCQIDESITQCDDAMHEAYTCNLDVVPQAYDQCIYNLEAAIDANSCLTSYPEGCGDVLCGDRGCGGSTTLNTDENPEDTSPTHSGSTSGETGGGT